VTDGATQVRADGTSGDAFNFTSFNLALQASGPNLADLGYLFHLLLPNLAPYRSKANAQSDGTHFAFRNIVGMLGASAIRGEIRSDHSGPRRRIDARFNAQTLTRADVEALLAPIPPRVRARSISGAVQASGTGQWLLPDSPFGLARVRAADFVVSLTAARVLGFALPLESLETHIDLDAGVLRFSDLSARLYGGSLQAHASLDGRHNLPLDDREGA
jgi:AsmA family protein